MTADREAMKAGVEYLASVECGGRAPGTEGGMLARRWVVDAFEQLDLRPAGTDGYLQPLPVIDGANILGILEGHGPLAHEHIVVAAHYDHLGYWGGDIYPGATDNAAAVTALIEIARMIAGDGALGRSVLFASFDAEEPPHFLTANMGSIAWVLSPTVPLAKVSYMVCLDILGHRMGGPAVPDAIGDSTFVFGPERSPVSADIFDSVDVPGVRLRRADAALVPPLSDHYAFEQAGIPFAFLTCGRPAAYHTPYDTADLVDVPKLGATAEALARVVTDLSRAPGLGEYQGERRDDEASVRAVSDMAHSLLDVYPGAEEEVELLRRLEQTLSENGELSEHERYDLTALILGVEAAMQMLE